MYVTRHPLHQIKDESGLTLAHTLRKQQDHRRRHQSFQRALQTEIDDKKEKTIQKLSLIEQMRNKELKHLEQKSREVNLKASVELQQMRDLRHSNQVTSTLIKQEQRRLKQQSLRENLEFQQREQRMRAARIMLKQNVKMNVPL